jgi:hypothetical protein
MKYSLVRLLAIIIFGGLIIFMLIYDHNNPPEKAKITDLRLGYYSTKVGWIYSSTIPINVSKLQVCGVLSRSKPAPLLFTISEPDDINVFLYQDEYYFELDAGNFCVELSLAEKPLPGIYTLWILDGRRTVVERPIEFVRK